MLMVDDRNFYQRYEIIGGKKIMAPSAPLDHSAILMRLGMTIGHYVVKNNCGRVFLDDTDVYLPDGNLFSPDLVVITAENFGIMSKRNAIYGVPDMVVEVLSKSTRKIDLSLKKNSYEACGVKEYWIIDPWTKFVDVYLLREGRYFFDEQYHKYSEEEWDELSTEERAEVKTEIKLSIFEDCFVKVEDIFAWCF